MFSPAKRQSRLKRKRLDEMDESELVETVFDLLGRGAIYFSDAQRLCHAATNDGLAQEAVMRLGRLGTSGKRSQNIERDAYRWLNSMIDIGVEPQRIPFYVQQPGRIGARWEMIPVLSIHEMFAALWKAGPGQRNLSLFGSSGSQGLKTFWRNATKHLNWAKRHPALQNKTLDEMSRIFPIITFIDGVEVYKNNEFIIFCIGACKN